MDPITQIFQQARAPSGSGNDLFNAYVQGAQLQQNNRRINLQEQEQTTMLPLKAEAERLATTEAGLNIQMKRDQLERNNQVKAGESDLLQIMLDAGNSPDGWLEESVVQRLRSLSVRNPSVFMTPTGQAALNSWRAAGVADEGFRRAKALADQYKTPVKEISVDRTTGQPIIKYGAVGGNALTIEGKNIELAQHLQDQIDTEDDPERKQYLTDRLSELKARMARDKTQAAQAGQRIGMSGQRIEQTNKAQAVSNFEKGVTVTPQAGGGYKVTQGARPITPGETTKLQDDSQRIENSFQGVQRALHAIDQNPDAFGPVGFVKDYLETALTLVDPTYDPRIRGARVTADIASEDIIRGLKQSGSMSDFEKKQLDALSKVTGPLTTAMRGKKALQAIEFGLAARALHNARTLKTEPPAWARSTYDSLLDLRPYTDQELLDAVKGGYVTRNQVSTEYERRRASKRQ